MNDKRDIKLFFCLLGCALVPSVYLLIKMHIVALNNVNINILGQLEWFDLIDETIVTILTVPLYYLLKPEKTNVNKNGTILYNGSASQPIFEVSDNLIKIVLPLLNKTTKTIQTLTDKTTQITQEIDATTQENIINILKNNPTATLQEVANKLNLSRDGVKYHITKLQKQGKVKHEGKDNIGQWIVTED